eukprot:gene8572-397_t
MGNCGGSESEKENVISGQRDLSVVNKVEGEGLKKIEKKDTHKVLLLGDSGVGKSSLLIRLVDDQFSFSHVSTIGCEYKSITLDVNEGKIKLNIWDTAGQDRFRSITKSYFRGATAVVFVYDICSRDSFISLKNNWYKDAKESLDEFIGIVVGNKLDLQDGRVVDTNQAKEFADRNGLSYIEASAKESTNVQEVFKNVATQLSNV